MNLIYMKEFCIYILNKFNFFYYRYCALSLPDDDEENVKTYKIYKINFKNMIER